MRQLLRSVLAVILSLVLINGVLILICIGLLLAILRGIDSDCSPENPGPIEQLGRFDYPPSAHVLDSGCFVWQGHLVWTQFEMAPEDMDAFLASTAIDGLLSENELPPDTTPPFNRDPSIPYLYGEVIDGHETGVFVQQIMIEIGNPDRYIVYLEASGD